MNQTIFMDILKTIKLQNIPLVLLATAATIGINVLQVRAATNQLQSNAELKRNLGLCPAAMRNLTRFLHHDSPSPQVTSVLFNNRSGKCTVTGVSDGPMEVNADLLKAGKKRNLKDRKLPLSVKIDGQNITVTY